MKISRQLKQWAALIACLQMGVTGIARGAQPAAAPSAPASAAPIASDVALSHERTLDGQVVTANGAPLAHSTVWAVQSGKVIGSASTDGQGWFSLADMKGGVYQLETENGASMVRAWTEASAPPSARPHALVVEDGQVARGQGAVRRIITNPWFWGIGIGTAIAVPVIIAATNDDKDDKPHGS